MSQTQIPATPHAERPNFYCIALGTQSSMLIEVSSSGMPLNWSRNPSTETDEEKSWHDLVEEGIQQALNGIHANRAPPPSRRSLNIVSVTDIGCDEDHYELVTNRAEESLFLLIDTIGVLHGRSVQAGSLLGDVDALHQQKQAQISAEWESRDEDDRRCMICRDPLTPPDGSRQVDGVEVATLLPSCGHLFGVACISQWARETFASHYARVLQDEVDVGEEWNPTCPYCRATFFQYRYDRGGHAEDGNAE
jgi:hypothetical protein